MILELTMCVTLSGIEAGGKDARMGPPSGHCVRLYAIYVFLLPK